MCFFVSLWFPGQFMVIYVLCWNLFVLSRSSLKMAINWIGESVVSNSTILSSDGRGIFPHFLEFTIWKSMYIGGNIPSYRWYTYWSRVPYIVNASWLWGIRAGRHVKSLPWSAACTAKIKTKTDKNDLDHSRDHSGPVGTKRTYVTLPGLLILGKGLQLYAIFV